MPSQEAGQEFMRLYLSEERQKRTRLVVAWFFNCAALVPSGPARQFCYFMVY
jgi:hypothetical protein